MKALKRKPYFSDSQLKRMLVQLMAAFAGYQVKTGLQRDGKPRFLDVPVVFGDQSRVASYITNGGSDNVVPALPIMSLYMTGLRQKSNWRHNPQHIEPVRFVERAMDPDGQPIINQPGKVKIVERFMPVPYDLTFEVAIWASNNEQGYQLVEQITTVFNPEQDVQLSNSPMDWTFLTTVFFSGEVRFEKAVIAAGDANPDPLYVFTFPFETVIWMSAPVKLFTPKPIYEIHVPILDLERELDFDSMTVLDGLVIRADEDDIIKSENLL